MTKGGQERGRAAGQVYDELLVTLVWSGDRRAGELLARRWHPRLLRTARRLTRDDDLAGGAAQDAWVSILSGIGSLRDPARFAPWAFGILRSRCADTIARASKQRQHIADRAPPDEAAQPVAEDAAAIRQAFAALPGDQRLAAHLFYVEGLTLAEIAEAAGVPEGTAKTRLFHARRKLKAALTGEGQ